MCFNSTRRPFVHWFHKYKEKWTNHFMSTKGLHEIENNKELQWLSLKITRIQSSHQ